MAKPNPSVDGFIRKAKLWQAELKALRAIVLECPLVEQVKWRTPCYTYGDHNVVLIGAFKAACVLSFMKGALLKDDKGVLEKPGQNTRAGRVLRLTSVQQINKLKPVIKAYIHEAIELEKAGAKVDMPPTQLPELPKEVLAVFKDDSALKKAFEALTPGRQRGYILHFSSAKQPKTRVARVTKCTPAILQGKGMHDR